MEFIDLSKTVPESVKAVEYFKSESLEKILGKDPFKQVGGYLIPSKDENTQVFLCLDRREYMMGMRIYKRHRESKDSEWEDWKFCAKIE